MSSQYLHRKPEIMSPAGYWPQLRAAIEAGADSVYFGLRHFTARAKVGFSTAELPEVMRTLHARGVRGYVTFNTLVFDHELAEAARSLAAIAEAGADAVIVQDFGVLELVRRIAPGLEVHASTQMSITSAAGVRLAQKHGVSRVTLARELSLKEIRQIRESTECELEIFVHGALCVAYSGQCFSSEAWGGRSANRGQCAQACRLPYELIVDGHAEPLGDARYLLSPGDLFALRQVPEIADIGVAALKIEGRYKDSDYVALATAAYRKAVDDAFAGREPELSKPDEIRLQQVYSRGSGPFFLTGTDHQAVVRGRAPRHRGVFMGRVVRVSPAGVLVQPSMEAKEVPLKAGDGVVFDAADWRSPEEAEEGGRIFAVESMRDGMLRIEFANGAVRFPRIRPGDLLWRTSDPDIDKVVRPLIEAAVPVRRQAVDVHVAVRPGVPVNTVWTLADHPDVQVSVDSAVAATQAESRGLSEALLRDQFGRLGNTAYQLRNLSAGIDGSAFVPMSVLNAMRREAVELLTARQSAAGAEVVNSPASALEEALRNVHCQPAEGHAQKTFLHLLVRTPEQLDAALRTGASSITLDYLDLYGLKPSVDRVRAAGIAVRVASPRVLKPGEERILDFLLRLECPLLIRSAGMLDELNGRDHPELTGDFSLNAANAITFHLFLQMGLARLTPTHDLNAEQIAALAGELPSSRLEVVAYGHLPVFHTEHCVFCRFLSQGTSYKDCGRPCETHQVALRDQTGREHPVIADVGCRNTVFGAEAQQASSHMDAWLKSGIRHFRLEFAHESAVQTESVTSAFRRFFSGASDADELARNLRSSAPQGVTEGSLFVPSGYLTLPVLQ